MATKPFEPEVLYDSFEAFPQGMDSGVQPVLLDKEQLAFLTNGSVRGTFIGPRAMLRQIPITFQSGGDIATAGVFQGAGYYKPDTGNEQLALVASGRLFIITPDPNTPTATAFEATIPGDPNPDTQPQAWLWQAENYLIWTDGKSQTQFYSGPGTTIRSNFGVTLNFSTTTATAVTIPALGGSASVDFTSVANLNVGDIITFKNNGQAIVTAIGGGGGVTVTFTNISAIPVGVVAAIGKVITWSHTGTQLPPGRMGAYWRGRVSMSLTDGKQFVIGDAVGGSSGTQANNFRDAVLQITENIYLAGGGYFSVPGSVGDIRAMVGTAQLDASLGQGPLLIVTPNITFSCDLPTDRLTWQSVTNPILAESMVTNGGLGQWSTFNANSDTIMRSVDGIRSLTLARRDFNTWGNTPISYEVTRILANDNRFLLKYSSGTVFDNRILMTASPQATARGVLHQGLVALNLDPVSTLRGKAPSVYDGLWTGVQILQIVTGIFNEGQRCFIFALNSNTNAIELYEVLPTGEQEPHFDVIAGGQVPVTYEFETAVTFKEEKNQKPRPKRLMNGEMFIDELDGRADFKVYWRPDSESCWTLWKSFAVCQTPGAPTPGYRPRIGFGEPPLTCDAVNDKPFREGFYFQYKVVVSGYVFVKKMNFEAVTIPALRFAKPAGCCPGDSAQ